MSSNLRRRQVGSEHNKEGSTSTNASPKPNKQRKSVKYVKYFFLFSLFIYVLVPVAIFIHPPILKLIVFENAISFPLFVDLEKPHSLIEKTRHLFIQSDDKLGIWHTSPVLLDDHLFDSALEKAELVFVYCHGNGPTRAEHHRVLLYGKLSTLNAHVISFDYRGYGDSPGDPSERGVITDAVAVINWVRRFTSAPLVLWGHSLGTGVATQAASLVHIDALILEAPFLSVPQGARDSALAIPWAILPIFESVVIEPLTSMELTFNNSKHISDVRVPVLILHAEDDRTIPYSHGIQLFDIAQKRASPTEFTSFGQAGFGHNYMCSSSKFLPKIKSFLKKYIFASK